MADKADAAAAYAQALQNIDEVVRRMDAIVNRVDRLEFLGNTLGEGMNTQLTAVAALFAGLCIGKRAGMPDHVALSIMALVHETYADANAAMWAEMLQRLRNELILRTPTVSDKVN